jgi:pimeloyl-ACP methyl ester carboxylesterase
MANLDGSPLPIEIAPGGYALQAPSLTGAVIEITQGDATTRGDGGDYEGPFLQAASGAGVIPVKTFAIDVTSVDTGAGAATRGGGTMVMPDGAPAIVLRVPSLGDDVEQAVLHTDEAGVSQWIFPSGGGAPGGPATRGGGGDVEFLLPLESAEAETRPDDGPRTRGRLTKLGRRLVRVLAWATEDIVGKGAMYVATRWEEQRRPYGLRRFPFSDPQPIAWDVLRGGRALLLLHGTFSTAAAAFELLPPETVEALGRLYGGRIFAFDHPTLHQSPEHNVRQLFQMLPDGTDLEVDIITHSRGGLVGRELTERSLDYASTGRTLKVRRAVFVAAPMRGTVLVDTEHGIEMLDRYTNLFTDLPDNPFTISMEAIFMTVKLVYHGAMKSLPGLRSMYPSGEVLQRLNKSPTHESEYYALAADFKPTAKSLLGRFGWAVADAAVDGIFGEANDGVVPTMGSYDLKSAVSGFPIKEANRVVFGTKDGIHHCNYFGSITANQHLLRWLGA